MNQARTATGKEGTVPVAPTVRPSRVPFQESLSSRLEHVANYLAANGERRASAIKFALAAAAQKSPERKASLYAKAAEQATLACDLKLTLLFDAKAMKYFREMPIHPGTTEHPLARVHRIESGNRYMASANDPASSWTEAERSTLREYANARMPDNQGSEIRGSGVPKSERFYGQWL